MAEMSDALQGKINALAELGDQYAEEGDFESALEQYWSAWDLLPEPKTDWDAGLWLLVAIGDANFNGEDFSAGVDNLTTALQCPDGMGNPFVHLRLGQCLFEVGDTEHAALEMTRAYTSEGIDIFEDEDPRYFDFLKTKLSPPPEGWPV